MTGADRRDPAAPPRVYVDDAFVAGDWGFWTGGGHLQADTAETLHEFAGRLGLKREWFQFRPGRPDRDHYDLTQAGRERAIALGAIAETVRAGNARRKAVRAAHGPSQADQRAPEPTIGHDPV